MPDGEQRRFSTSPAAASPAEVDSVAFVKKEQVEDSPIERLVRHVLPFLKLQHAGRRGETQSKAQTASTRQTTMAEVFLVGSMLWLTMLIALCYILLSISSSTFHLKAVKGSDPPVYVTERKTPSVGSHFDLVCLAKQILLIFLIHHLCGNVMEPLEAMRDQKYVDLHEIEPQGLVHGLRRVQSFVLGRPYEPRWLSSFITDHILLMLVGLCAVANEVSMCAVKLDAHSFEREEGIYITGISARHPAQMVIEALVSIYCIVLVMGFLLTTLEDNAVPKPGKQKEFLAAMTLLVLLWMTNFLTILFDRQVFTSMWIKVGPSVRVLAAAAQVFVTHSSVMLGAVVFGHSAHFKKCPDITWQTFWRKVLPLLVALVAFLGTLGGRRYFHDHASCRPLGYKYLAEPWPYFFAAFSVIGGLLLLGMTMPGAGSSSQESSGAGNTQDVGDDELGKLLDYDSALVLITFSMALIWNVVNTFAMEASGYVMCGLMCGLGLAAPLGLAAFALTVWRHPPPLGTWRSLAICFGLFFAGSMFTVFQEKEDCEISSDLPGCCGYPLFPEYNQAENRRLMCNKDRRCMQKNADGVYCAIPESVEVIEEHSGAEASKEHSGAEEPPRHFMKRSRAPPRGLQSSVRLAPTEEDHLQDCGGNLEVALSFAVGATRNVVPMVSSAMFNTSICRELDTRWRFYTAMLDDGFSHAMQDAKREEEEQSTAYRLLLTWGQAASVEMYFTIFGVLLKVFFLTNHPNSERTLSFDSHHHEVCAQSGENKVVSRRTAKSRWTAVRSAAKLAGMRGSIVRSESASTAIKPGGPGVSGTA
eukprot:TRINITY_DN34607_c0_g1_i1.p1 TRINITY_DN34607_c0_g1~~TRINITY_DN34607_c0_g1_i1.p1  ORF type:complete len:814 (-),score=140.43 TRINITY_DN34607_c0_g1_i1:82-2523(-)